MKTCSTRFNCIQYILESEVLNHNFLSNWAPQPDQSTTVTNPDELAERVIISDLIINYLQ